MAQSDAEIMKLVLEAEDRLTPDLTKLEQRITSLTWSLVELSESSKIDFRELTWSDRELALLHNSIIDNTTALEGLTKWTDEYNITLHALMKSVDSYIEKKQQLEDIATQEVVESLKRQQAIADYNYEQKMSAQILKEQETQLQNYVKQTSNVAQSVEYWKQKVEDIKVAISDQAAKLKDAEQTYWTTSKQANAQREELQRLEKEYKQLNRTLKDAKQNQWFFADSLDLVRDKIKQNLALTIGKSFVSFAVQGVKEMAHNILEYWNQMNAVSLQFEQMSSRAWMSYTNLRNTLRESSKGMVSDIDLMQSANRAMSLWVAQDVDSMSNLMKIAQVRWAQMWETTAKAFDDITTWIGRQSAMILDNLWIVINAKDAYERYATSIGKSTDELTKQEKQQAYVNEVIRQSGEELKARENMPLTASQKIEKLKVSTINSFAAIWDAFFKRTEPMLDEIIKISDTLTDRLIKATDEFNQSSWNIWYAVSSTLDNIWENAQIVWWNIKVILDSAVDVFKKTAEFLGEIINGIWKALWQLFYWIDKDSNDSAYSFRDHFLLAITLVGQAFSSLSLVVNQFWRALNQWTENISNWATAIWWWLKGVWEAMNNDETDLVTAFQRWFWTAEVVETEIITRKDAMAERETLWGQFITQVENLWKDLVDADRYTSSQLWDWWKSIFGDDKDNSWWGWGSSKSKKKEETWLEKQIKLMKEYGQETKRQHQNNATFLQWLNTIAKDYQKELEDKIKATSKEFEKASKEVQDKIDDTTKNIEKLEKEIDNLNDKLKELWKDENTSLAQEVIKEQDELKKLEKQFEWITDIAKSVSWDELNNTLDTDFIGWYSVENLKKAKQYSEGLAWLYDDMSNEQIDALKEEIKYQEWFNSLNPIEKIKEEYNVKRKEIQAELEEKEKALQIEYETKKQYEDELLAIQKEYEPILEELEAEYQKIGDLRIKFEERYSDWLTINWEKELSYAERIRKAWEQANNAKAWAFLGWGWGSIKWYAEWWSVIAWKAIMVWERGPELFVPKSNWDIVPNEVINNNGISINLSWITVRSDADINAITDEIIRKIKLEKTFWIA